MEAPPRLHEKANYKGAAKIPGQIGDAAVHSYYPSKNGQKKTAFPTKGRRQTAMQQRLLLQRPSA
jgi:hypothetical protein